MSLKTANLIQNQFFTNYKYIMKPDMNTISKYT